MLVRRLRVLRGPNPWAACPVLVADVDVGSQGADECDECRRFAARLRSLLLCLGDEPGGEPASPAHVLERLTLCLQTLAGNPVKFGRTRRVGPAGRFQVAVEYREEPVGRASLQTALGLWEAARANLPFPVAGELERLRALADEQRLGPSTLAVVEAARERGIPVDHFNPEDGRYLLLGQGCRQRRSLAAETDEISAVARSVTTDKHLSKLLLREAGVPVPWGRPVAGADDAWAAACDLGLPVTVKPQDRDCGQGVGLNLRTREQVVAAYRAARAKSPFVLVERFVRGAEHRVLVVAERVVAVARMEPPQVIGDGRSSVRALVASANRDPLRGDGPPAPLRRLNLDAAAEELLAEQGYAAESVPPAGARVLLRRDPPFVDNGGSLRDETTRIHPAAAACAVAAARALGVRVAGIDVVAEDIGRPLEEQGGAVVEVNTGPGLGLHTAGGCGNARAVGAAVVASLFPPGQDGRIPVLAVSGGRARAAGRRLAALLTERGFRVGRASEEGVFIVGRRFLLEGSTAFERARAVLRNTEVDVAVLEATARDLLTEGLGCDRCDVALLTALPDQADDPDELADAGCALLHALSAGGHAVINVDCPPRHADLLPPPERVIWIANDRGHPRRFDLLAAGSTSVFLSGDSVVVARGGYEKRLAFGAQPDAPAERESLALLAAVAGTMSLDLCGDEKRGEQSSPPGSRRPILSTV